MYYQLAAWIIWSKIKEMYVQQKYPKIAYEMNNYFVKIFGIFGILKSI